MIREKLEKLLETGIDETANMGDWLESQIRLGITSIADEMYGSGYLSRVERISLSKAVSESKKARKGIKTSFVVSISIS